MDESFIGEFSMTNKDICDDLIYFFKNNVERHRKGIVSKKGVDQIDEEHKTSIDLEFPITSSMENVAKRYLNQLKICTDAYINKFKYCNEYSTFGIVEPINIQYYPPYIGNFKKWHTERHHKNCDRHLVFMTYLNNVNTGGETEFYHQKISIKPIKGKTLIWPADWTHTHRGNSSPEEKYIITGWLNYI
jgi:prolyl 4-hydroxylase